MKKFIFLVLLNTFMSQARAGEGQSLFSLQAESFPKQKLYYAPKVLRTPSAEEEQVEIEEDSSSKDNLSIQDLVKLENDKEPTIASFNKIEKERLKWKYSNKDENKKIKQIFSKNIFNFLQREDAHCELNLIDGIIRDFEDQRIKTQDEVIDQFKILRISNSIDDILYEALEQITIDYFRMKSLNYTHKPIRNVFKNYKKLEKDFELDKIFSTFSTIPDEKESCLYREFFRVRESVSDFKDNRSVKNQKIKDYAFIAWKKNIISIEAFNRIKYLSDKSTINERSIWLNDYFKIIFSAKDKLIPFKRNYKVINIEDENSFSSERIRRFSTLTRRKLLFSKYDETQIILMAKVMKKASQRMGVDPDTETEIPYLIQNFKVHKRSGQVENISQKIELDTQSQFNLARRLLRKDIVNLQMMKTFQKVKISYEDIVMASLETGYISLDDIEYVVKYDDLWNSQISKSERLLNFSFKIAGYGTFFLPAPWNVTAALALSIVEGIVDSNRINGASNDNPNTFIE